MITLPLTFISSPSVYPLSYAARRLLHVFAPTHTEGQAEREGQGAIEAADFYFNMKTKDLLKSPSATSAKGSLEEITSSSSNLNSLTFLNNGT